MQIDVLYPENADTCVLCVQGEVHSVDARELERHLVTGLQTSRSDLVVDLSGVGFITSEGLGALVRARQQARRLGIEMLLVAPPEPAVGVLRATGLTKVFTLLEPGDAERLRAFCMTAC